MSKKREREKRKDAYPKKVCHMLAKACQKNVDSSRLKITKGERVRQKEFILESPKIVHTLAHLDQVV